MRNNRAKALQVKAANYSGQIELFPVGLLSIELPELAA
jgi:hypothetical protein